MTRDPILTIGELEPERPTVAIRRNAPDGWWQRFKFHHLDVLLRWFPVRFAHTEGLYPLRHPSEFGMRNLQRIRRMQQEVAGLRDRDDPAAMARIDTVLREITALILVAPRDVIESLTLVDRLQVLAVFPRAVTGQTPTADRPENPPTSDASSPASTASTVPGTG